MRSPFHRDPLSEAHTAEALRLRPVDLAARQLRADVETPPPPPPPADPAEDEADDLARALSRALRGRKKPRGIGAEIAAALAGRGPIDPPETTGEPVIALNDDDTLRALALGAMTSKETMQ